MELTYSRLVEPEVMLNVPDDGFIDAVIEPDKIWVAVVAVP